MDLREEKRQDAYREAKEEQQHENDMYDYEYAVDFVVEGFNLEAALSVFEEAVKTMNEYGHEMTVSELISEM